MTKCEGTGSITKNGVDFFSTDTRDSTHNVPCKIACANCRSPMFDEVREPALDPYNSGKADNYLNFATSGTQHCAVLPFELRVRTRQANA